MNNMISNFQQFMRSPMQAMRQMGIPQNMSDPNEITQYLMNSGRISQAQYNQAKMMANQMRSNPMFASMFR